MNKNILLASLAGALLLSTPTSAAAAPNSIGSRQYDGANSIQKGTTEIGLDSLWILAYSKQEDTETSRLSMQTGITVRRFIRDNVAVGGKLSGFYHSLGEDDDERGAMGMAVANYYMRLGSGMFFAPGVGLGGLVGTRDSTPAIGQSSLVGGTMSVALPFVFYSSSTFNLRAGFDMLITAGSATPEAGGESSSYTTVDGGFSVGGGYIF